MIFEVTSDESMLGKSDLRVMSDDARRCIARPFEKIAVEHEIGNGQRRRAALPRAEKFARTTQLQVDFGDPEPVVRLDHRLQAPFGAPFFFAQLRRVKVLQQSSIFS